MCKPISWFYVRHGGATRLIISEKSDSHTEIAEEFGIRDTVGDVAAGEFSTDVANPSPDLKTWRLVWDYQGMSPRFLPPIPESCSHIDRFHPQKTGCFLGVLRLY